MSIDVMSYIWKHSPSKGSELLLLLALADYASHDGTAHPSVKHLAEKCRMTERNVQLLFKNLVASKQLSIRYGQGSHGCHLFRLALPKEVTQLARGEKISPEKISPEKISPQGIEANTQENQQVISERGEKISPEKISPEKISGVKSSALLQPQISPLPSVDPSREDLREDLTPQTPLAEGGESAEAKALPKHTTESSGRVVKAKAKAILDYFNAVHSHAYENATVIEALLRSPKLREPTLEDCKLVIDYLYAVERVENPDSYKKYVTHTTPFRPENFERHRERARQWDAQGRPHQREAPSTPKRIERRVAL